MSFIALPQFYPGGPSVATSMQECTPKIVQQSTLTHAQLSLEHLSSSSSLYPHSFSTSSSTASILTESGYGSLETSGSSVQLKSRMKKHSSQMSFGSAASSTHASQVSLHPELLRLTEESIAEHSSTEEESCFEDTSAREERPPDTTFRVSSEDQGRKLTVGRLTASRLLEIPLDDLKEEIKEEIKEEMKEYCTQILQEKIEDIKLESSGTSSFSEHSTANMPAMEQSTCTCSGSPCSSKNPDALISSHSCPLLEEKGVQTPENLRRLPDRLHSDSEYMKRVMLRRKPKLSDVRKAHSASDAVSNMHSIIIICS